ncbi:MAG: GntR family transcriptional regulator [Gammaproteobacteria bacterium]|nr:GntR family transcriptional regulator [Gammaproteobacteria bacterium]MBU1444131.1 GntR family transcriptional regulator [Gammaproteobacteria bacterium]MBU2285575.1 GntR family transcriptional regulator [Gammaproteobacteria bacterium]MBU2407352.1 GntR family transcriptional regulator [Gammaproteobacteria bacterium]
MNVSDLLQLLERFSRPGVPKYVALYDAVMHAVASGLVAPGDRVPNEQELAKVLPVSLGTIQRALRRLVDERVIQRRPGMGSFISERHAGAQMERPFHCRFVDDSGVQYLPVFPEILSRDTVAGPGPWTAHLRCVEVVRIIRRIRIGDEFYVHSTFAVDPVRLAVFREARLEQLDSENFKQTIFRACGQAIHKVDLFTRQEVPPPDIARQLEIAEDTLCVAMRVHAFLGDSDPIYYQTIYTPPTPRELHIVSDSRAPGFMP